MEQIHNYLKVCLYTSVDGKQFKKYCSQFVFCKDHILHAVLGYKLQQKVAEQSSSVELCFRRTHIDILVPFIK